MTSRFRTGQIVACSYLLEIVPRSVFIAALVKHVQADRPEGNTIRSEHAHEEHRFHIETDADGNRTHVRLEP